MPGLSPARRPRPPTRPSPGSRRSIDAAQQRPQRPQRSHPVGKQLRAIPGLDDREPVPRRWPVAAQGHGPRRAVGATGDAPIALSPSAVIHPEPSPPAGFNESVPVGRDQVDSASLITAGQRVPVASSTDPDCPCQALARWCRTGRRRSSAPGSRGAPARQTVVTEPLPGLVQRHDEQVFPVEDADRLRRIGRADHGRAQRRAEPAENGRPREKLPDRGRWRLSASSIRKSVMNRLSPPNWPTKAPGEGWPRSESAAR